MTHLPEEILTLQRRCPRLGGPVAFDYCRRADDGRAPCFKVFDCWWERFDVVDYFRQHLSQTEFSSLQNSPPPNKAASLVELIRQARQRIKP
jgi:hypothetical protein